MNAQGDRVQLDKRKLLGFTDNRQDAALQAGHFNDSLFVSLFRAATLAAVQAAGTDGLGDEEFGRRLQTALGFTAANQKRRKEWLARPEVLGVGLLDAERTLARVLAHRVWAVQRRGWRFTNPSLEELGLVCARYVALDELASDEEAFLEPVMNFESIVDHRDIQLRAVFVGKLPQLVVPAMRPQTEDQMCAHFEK